MGASTSTSTGTPRRKSGPTEPSAEHTIVDMECFDAGLTTLTPTPPRTPARKSSIQPAFDVVKYARGSSLSVCGDGGLQSPTIPQLPVISPPSSFTVPASELIRFCPTPPAIRLPPTGQAWAHRRGSRVASNASSVSDLVAANSLSLDQLTIHSAVSSQLPSDSEDELGAIIAVEKDNEDEASLAAKRTELEPLQDYTPVQPIDPQAAERSRRLCGDPCGDGAYGGQLSSDHRYDLLRMDLEQHSVSTPAGYLLDGNGALWECPGLLDSLPTSLNRFELIALSNKKPSGNFTISKLGLPVTVMLPGNPLFAKPTLSNNSLRWFESQGHNLDGGVAGRLLSFLDTAANRIAELRNLLYSKEYNAATKAAMSLLGGIETFPMCHRLRSIAQAIASAVSCVALSSTPKQLMHALALRGDDGIVPRGILRVLSVAPELGLARLEQFCRHRFEYGVLLWRNTVHFLRHYLQKSAAEDVGHRSPDEVLPWTLPGKQPEQNE